MVLNFSHVQYFHFLREKYNNVISLPNLILLFDSSLWLYFVESCLLIENSFNKSKMNSTSMKHIIVYIIMYITVHLNC